MDAVDGLVQLWMTAQRDVNAIDYQHQVWCDLTYMETVGPHRLMCVSRTRSSEMRGLDDAQER